jgi:hypothetical protein
MQITIHSHCILLWFAISLHSSSGMALLPTPHWQQMMVMVMMPGESGDRRYGMG